MAKTMDDILNEVGSCGCYQKLLVSLAFTCVPTSVWSMMFMMFGALESDWWCVSRDMNFTQSDLPSRNPQLMLNHSSSHFSDQSSILNQTISLSETVIARSLKNASRLNFSVWNDSEKFLEAGETDASFKRCGKLVNITEQLCESIRFSPHVRTVVSEEQFHLVCDLDWVPATMISVQMVGVLVGSGLSGQLSDSLGRKKTLIILSLFLASFNLIAAFSTSWQMFTVMRAMIGVTVGGIICISLPYHVEFLGVRWRALIYSIPLWGLSSLLFSLIVWLLKDWRHVHLATAACTVAVLPSWIFLPESIRWLLVKGHVTQAHHVLKKMAHWNGRKALDISVLDGLSEQKIALSQKNYTYFDIFARWPMAKVSISSGFMWFSISVTYYGMTFGVKDLSGDFYANIALIALVELPSRLLVFHFTKWFGRRWSIVVSYMLVSCCCLAVLAVSLLIKDRKSADQYVYGFSLAARLAMVFAWGSVGLIVTELYPTVVRNIGLGFCNMMARIGAVVAPYLWSTGGRNSVVFFVTMGSCMALSGVSVLFLPETADRPLEDNLQETSGQSAVTNRVQRETTLPCKGDQ